MTKVVIVIVMGICGAEREKQSRQMIASNQTRVQLSRAFDSCVWPLLSNYWVFIPAMLLRTTDQTLGLYLPTTNS